MSNNELITIKSVEDGYYLEFLTEEGKEVGLYFYLFRCGKGFGNQRLLRDYKR